MLAYFVDGKRVSKRTAKRVIETEKRITQKVYAGKLPVSALANTKRVKTV